MGTTALAKTMLKSRTPLARLRAPGMVLAAFFLISGLHCSNGPSEPTGGGRVVWRAPGKGVGVMASSDATTAFFGTFDGELELVAVDKLNGKVRWRARTGVFDRFAFGDNTVAANDVVAVPAIDILAYDKSDGRFRWRFRPADDDEPGRSYLATSVDMIFAGSLFGRLFAVDASTGALRWQTQLPGSEVMTFSPTLNDGLVFVGLKHFVNPPTGGLAAVDQVSGELRWVKDFLPSYPGAVSGCLGAAVFQGNNVLAASEDGTIYALDRQSGAVRWTAPRVHPIPPEPGGGYGDNRSLGVVGDVVVVSSATGIIVGLNAATGSELWRINPRSGSPSGHVISTDGKLAFFTASGRVFAVDAQTGAIRWNLGGGIGDDPYFGVGFFSTPLVDGPNIYLPGETGLYALRKD